MSEEKKLNGTVIVTYRCNARCSMCNRYKAPSKPEEEISIETIKKLPKMYFTNITGGEPFIRTDLKDIVRELYKKSDRIVISTNGFFTDRIVDLCKEFPQIGIRISIEGLEQTNNEIRGLQNGYQRGYGTLKKLREMGMKDVGFGMTVQDKNAPDLVPLYKISDEMGMEFATASLHGNHQAGNYTKRQYPLKGKVYCGYCRKLMKYRVLKKLGPSFNCRFSATAVDSPCKRIPISEKMLEEIVRNALTVQIKQAEHMLEILHERERKALIFFSALERQEEKLSAEKAELVKLRVALYEQYADGNMSKEEFIRQRDAYRVQEDERMEQIQRLRTEKDQIFQPVKKDTDNLQAMMNTVGEAGDVMHLSQNVVEAFIDRIEVFNDERVKIHFTFEDVLADHAE